MQVVTNSEQPTADEPYEVIRAERDQLRVALERTRAAAHLAHGALSLVIGDIVTGELPDGLEGADCG